MGKPPQSARTTKLTWSSPLLLPLERPRRSSFSLRNSTPEQKEVMVTAVNRTACNSSILRKKYSEQSILVHRSPNASQVWATVPSNLVAGSDHRRKTTESSIFCAWIQTLSKRRNYCFTWFSHRKNGYPQITMVVKWQWIVIRELWRFQQRKFADTQVVPTSGSNKWFQNCHPRTATSWTWITLMDIGGYSQRMWS